MPGCTAPNCTNSSQKGFKLYHFPTDRERSSLWVRNCGRECGWKPTKHTCVCEVHFEESQFESHRADGLRKLKPNAIPTIFNRVTPHRSYTRKAKKESSSANVCPVSKENESHNAADGTEFKISSEQIKSEPKESTGKDNDGPLQGEYDGLKELDHTYPKFTSEEGKNQNILNKDDAVAIEEVSVNVSQLPSVRGRKRGRPVGTCDRKCDDERCPQKSRTSQARKRGRPPGSTNKSPASLSSPVRKPIKISLRNRGQLQDTDQEIMQEDCPLPENNTKEFINGQKGQCFVCDKNVNNGISLHTLTNTTKVHMHHKLGKILMGELEILIGEDGILCIRCANLLNYVDRIEVELSMLTKAILNCIRKKYRIGVMMSDKTHGNLFPNTEEEEKEEQGNCDEEINRDLQLSSKEETSNQGTEYADGATVCSDTSDGIQDNAQNAGATNNKHESSPSEEMQCRVCRFRTSYKSVMIFHLRRHMKDSYWCDFCNIALPKGAVDQMGRDHVIDIDRGDEYALVDVKDDADAIDNAVREANGSDLKSMDLMITVLPVSAQDVGEVAPQKIAINPETFQSRRSTLPNDDDDDRNSSSLNPMQSMSNSGKCIRVLNELGMIITQEGGSSQEAEGEGTVVSEENTDSHVPTNCNTLDLIVGPRTGDRSEHQNILNQYLIDSQNSKGSSVTEIELNVGHSQFSVMNDIGIIEVTSIQPTEQLQIDGLSSDASEMRVNVTPGMMTYSNNVRRLNVSLVDNPCELN